MALPGPGRYTMQVTLTLFADSPRDAYQQIDRALGADWRRHRITFVDAEETRVEPFCCHYETHDRGGGRRTIGRPDDGRREPGSSSYPTSNGGALDGH